MWASHRLKVLWFAGVHGTPEIHSTHRTPQELMASIQTTPRNKTGHPGPCIRKKFDDQKSTYFTMYYHISHIIPHFYHIFFYCCFSHKSLAVVDYSFDKGRQGGQSSMHMTM